MDIHITRNKLVIIEGKLMGSFDKLKKKIIKNNPDLVRKFSVKARYLGEGSVDYIADWKQVIKEYINEEYLQGKKTRKS